MVRVNGRGGSRQSVFESTIDARGRTTLPKAVRQALDLQVGERLRYTVEGREARIQPLRSVARLRGIVQHDGPPLSLEDMDKAVAEGAFGPSLR